MYRLTSALVVLLLLGCDRPQPAGFSRYFQHGVVDGVAIRTVDIGRLAVPSGRIVVADPFHFREGLMAPFPDRVEAGTYPVTLSLAKLEDWGERVAFVRITFSSEKVARWQVAGTPFSVDSGLAAYSDFSGAQAYAEALQKFEREHPTGNYYDDVLSRDLPADAKWGVHRPDSSSAIEIAVVSSGLGDGAYSSYWGFDASGRIAQLVTDFQVFESNGG